MTRIWIGDLHTEQIQNYLKAKEIEADNIDAFITNSTADYSWFSSIALDRLATATKNEAYSVIIMLGLTDCIYSCIWDSMSISDAANNYVETLNKLINSFTTCKFYFCSVGPVEDDYSCTYHKNGKVLAKDLNAAIKTFNNIIKEKCDNGQCGVSFLDYYGYLTSSSSLTYDGIHYTLETCVGIQSYVLNTIDNVLSGSSFSMRTSAPAINYDSEDGTLLSGDFWVSNSSNTAGKNPFPRLNDTTGSTLPNCTAYAWGRIYELLGSRPTLSTHNAEYWYLRDGSGKYNKYFPSEADDDGYARGDTPELGAVICWQKGDIGGSGSDGAGHVGVVEHINEDGSIITSESGYQDYEFRLKKRTSSGGAEVKYENGKFVEIEPWNTTREGSWGAGNDYKFQGFIYCPIVKSNSTVTNDDVDKSQVVSREGYLSEAEMTINARYICKYLSNKGWSLNAIAGILGNMEHESAINPGRHESGGSGFGLVQWTPKSKLTNWTSERGYADDDIDGQLERIIWEKDNKVQYYQSKYKYTFDSFSTSTDDPYTLACAFAFDYERSGVAIWGFNREKCNNDCPSSDKRMYIRCKSCYTKKYGATAASKQADINKQALRDKRGGSAEKWYTKLLSYSYTPSTILKPKFVSTNFKIDSLTATSIKASFIIKCGKSSYYELFNSKNIKIDSKPIPIAASESDLEIVSFRCDNLIPNTQYKLVVTNTSSIGEEKRDHTLAFTTPQDFPKMVSKVELIKKDNMLPGKKFQLIIESANDWGYWKKNSCGYDIQLIVNNKIIQVQEKAYSLLPAIWEFNLDKDFKNYKSKIGDIIQIGICTWVTDDANNKISDQSEVKTSNTICFLTQSVKAYIK